MDEVSIRSRQLLAEHSRKCAENITNEQIVEAALVEAPSVDACVVLERETQACGRELVAYVVSSGKFSPERLHSYLQATLPTAKLPIAYVPVSNLPLTATGQVDKQALARIVAIDADLVQQWEERLQQMPEIERVAVVVREHAETTLPLHLSDLLPDRKAHRASSASPIANSSPYGSAVAQEQGVATALSQVAVQPESQPKPLAISEGEPLREEPGAPHTLASALQRARSRTLGKDIIYLQADGSEITQTYAALLDEAQRILGGLRKLGLKPQDKVIFQLDRNQDFIPAFWGCILGGFVPVPISIAPTYESVNGTVNKLQNAWQLLERPPILTNARHEAAIRSLSNLLGLENFQVETIDDLRSCEPDQNWHDSQPDDLAVLLLTSGSTGIPKGVMLTGRNILSNVSSSAQMNGLSSEDVSLNWLNLDHVGSLVRCSIRDIYVGCQQIHAPAEAVLEDPLRWLDWIEQYRVTFAWAPNFGLGLINNRAEAIKQRRWDLSSVKSVLSVAEAIVPKTAKRFWELLAPYGLSIHAMHSAWGMSETCAAVTFSHRYLLELPSDDHPFVEVGAPIPGFKMRIVDGQEQVVQEDTIGHLQIKGPMIASGYYENPQLNQEAFTEDGWLKTGDLGFLHEGRLTITGRQKDVIIINGLNYYSHEIEAVVQEVEGVEVSYTAACAIRDTNSDTDQLAIFFHTPLADDRLVALLKEIRGNVGRKTGANPAYLVPVPKEAIPKTSIGKIQRSQLKARFEAGEFDHILKQLDILSGNANTLPDWFYRKVWRRKEAIALSPQVRAGQFLVFLDKLGNGAFLWEKISQFNQPCVAVEAGLDFAKLDSNRYRIDPQNPDHYRQLLESLQTDNLRINQILHLWTYDEYAGEVSSLEAIEQAQERGVYSLLYLVQALAGVQGSRAIVRLWAISSHTQPTSPDDKIAYEKSPILGLIKTISQEMPWLDCRHIDLGAEQVDVNAAQVLRELKVIEREPEVAYRDGQRLIPRLEKVDLRSNKKQDLPFKRGRMYLLSGGLGGVGLEVAKYLLDHYKAKLLLVGRTPLPERSAWEFHLAQQDAVSERIKTYQALEQLGGDIVYSAVDICDLEQLQQVLLRAKFHWGCELDGVIHLAGIGRERLLVEETRESFSHSLRPKVFGTWVLHQLVKEQPECLFISFSSVISFFGVTTVGAYAAANSFLDCFWHHQKYNSRVQSYCFGSSTWAGVGISRGYENRDSRYAQGREVMSVEQGLNSFLASLHHEPAHLLVGLNGTNPHIRRHLESEHKGVQKLCAYFTTQTEPGLLSKLQELEVRDREGTRFADRFGTPSTCEFIQLQEMPLTDTGEIDRVQLTATGWRTTAKRVAPRTELERRIATIWQEVLGVPQVSIHDNFFELGGNSLLAVQLFTQIEKVCGKHLPLSTLFQAATVEQLATILQQEEGSALWSSLVAIQSGGSKPPLFAVHEITGQVLFYRDLARHLGPEQPFYGLQPLGWDGKQTPLTRCEDMAAHYIKEIRTLQPQGPYFLVGFSFGGLLAFEMARLLHAQGQKVALLALIDTYTHGDEQRFSLRERVSRHLSNLLRLGPTYFVGFLKNRIQMLKNRVQERTLQIGRNFDPMIEPPLPDAPNYLSLEELILQANTQASRNYIPQLYPGRITFFRPIDPAFFGGWQPDVHLCWDERVGGGLEVYEVPGDHLSMIKEPDVQVLAEKLKACLAKGKDVKFTFSLASETPSDAAEVKSF